MENTSQCKPNSVLYIIIEIHATTQKLEDPNLHVVHEVDITPEIHYNQEGKAVQIVEYWLCNMEFRARSIYGITSKGEYTEWHEDPEHGNWECAKVVPRSRLEELDKSYLNILGADEKTVREILKRKRKKAKHLVFTPQVD